MTQSAVSVFQLLVKRYASRHLWVLLLVAILTLAANLLTVIQPMILAALLANLSGGGFETVPPDASLLDLYVLGARVTEWMRDYGAVDTTQLLIIFGVLFLTQTLIVSVTNYGADYGAAWLRVRYTKMIQLDLLKHLLAQDIAFFSEQKSGGLISRVTRDSADTAFALGPLIRSLIHQSVQIVMYAAYLFSTSIWLTIGAVAFLLFQFGFTELLRRPTRRLVRRETDTAAGLSTALQEALTGIRVSKSFGAEDFELSRLETTIDRSVVSNLSMARVAKLEVPSRSFLDGVAVLGVFLIAIQQMEAGQLSFQGLLLFTFVGRLLIRPINALATVSLYIEAMSASFARINELFSIRPRVHDGHIQKSDFLQKIRFENVSFSYGERLTLHNINLEIEKGEFIALVGPSGGGKSTLTDLILRLYDPAHGEIEIDGVNVKQLQMAEYRRCFGVVPQETILFNGTVRENIRYGREGLSDEDICAAAEIANAHDFIMLLPDKYDSVIGDRGIRLSGGERQRLSIARAVAHRPKVLILDEATSSLDSESEHLVQVALDQIVASTTAIVIAHRLSTVMHADRIIVVKNGRIEASGTNEELLQTNQTYQTLYERQFLKPVNGPS